ncbi:MAG: hypothetical protein H6744_10055 [Deltaproteobacteria bacterium]|nr:hypothetical protein [Deltaproteobacteria bacterium]
MSPPLRRGWGRHAGVALALLCAAWAPLPAWASDPGVDPVPAEDGDVDPRPPDEDEVEPERDDDVEPTPAPQKPAPPAPRAAARRGAAPRAGEPPTSPAPTPTSAPTAPPTAAPIPTPAPEPGASPVTSPAEPAAAPARAPEGEDPVIIPPEPEGPPRKPLGLMSLQAIPTLFVGVGGKGSVDIASFSDASALQPSFGFGLQLDFPVHRYFAFGPTAEMGFWNSHALRDAGYGRSIHADLCMNLRARLPVFSDRAELYLAVPVGFSLSLLNDVLSTTTGKGWVIGTWLGIKVYARPSWGFLFEAGWSRHAWKQTHDPSVVIAGKAPPAEAVDDTADLQPRTVQGRIHQFIFRVGVIFRL